MVLLHTTRPVMGPQSHIKEENSCPMPNVCTETEGKIKETELANINS